MENREFLEQIQQYAVRIGNAGDKELYGSGKFSVQGVQTRLKRNDRFEISDRVAN